MSDPRNPTTKEIWDALVARSGVPEVDRLGERMADALGTLTATADANLEALTKLDLVMADAEAYLRREN